MNGESLRQKFLIRGGKKLEGEIEVRGAKNSAGPVLAATLLTDEECFIENLPKVSDILNLLDILEQIGKKVEWVGEREVRISGAEIDPKKIDFEKVSKSRVSVLLIGALIPRVKEFKFSRPGGDRIGLRPIEIHLNALKELGVTIEERGDFYFFKREKTRSGEIVLSEFSVTATENLLMAAALTEGTTVIKGAAQEPHVQDLIAALIKMGAKIKRRWANVLEVEGVKKLGGMRHFLIPDTNEAGTFLMMGAAMGERLRVKKIIPEHLDLFLNKLKEAGISFKKEETAIEIWRPAKFYPIKVQALPYPGFPTDLLPLIIPLLTQAEGKSLIHDPLYENRLTYIHELRKMGADIEITDPHRCFVFGKTPLKGVTIESWDIRAGASLVLASLIAEGETTIKNIEQIDRGYEAIEERLQKVGAEIKRLN